MNLPIAIRARRLRLRARPALRLWPRAVVAWRALSRAIVGDPVYGDPRHEAWDADGQPLERTTPAQAAKDAESRRIIVPHSRGR